MDTERDVHTRLHQMVNKDPLGREAHDLLQRLSIIKGPISRGIITHLAPKELPRPIRMQAFATLVKWGFAYRSSGDAYLKEEARTLFPDDDSLYDSFLGYLELYALAIHRWLIKALDNDGLLPFCTRFIDRNPTAILRLLEILNKTYPWSLIEAAYAALQPIADPTTGLGALIRILNRHAVLNQDQQVLEEQAHQQVIEIYRHQQNRPMQQLYLILLGNVARRRGNRSTMLTAYEQAVEMNPKHQQLTLIIFGILIEAALEQNQRETALQYFAVAQERNDQERWPPARQRSENLTKLAQMAAMLGLYEKARDYFARAASIWESADLYWEWGQFEYQHAHQEAGCNLCRLSMLILWKNMIMHSHLPQTSHPSLIPLWHTRRQALIEMGCEDG